MWYTLFITLVIDVGGLVLVYALLRDRIRRATSAAGQIAELRDEVSRLVVELNQTTERNIALIEDRIGTLNELLNAADRKMGLLHREIEKHDVGAHVYSRLAEGGARGIQARRQQGTTEHVTVGPEAPARSPEAKPPEAARGEDGHGAEDSRDTAAGARETRARSDDVHQRVMMLSRSGFSASLIAGRVGIPLGEVELIISLERQRMSQPEPRAEETTE